jgi:hypothetical protein
MVVRGFANEENRLEETNKAIKHIAEWREKVIFLYFYSTEGRGAVEASWLGRLDTTNSLKRI